MSPRPVYIIRSSPRPKWRFLPVRWRYRVRDSWVQRTLKPLLSLAALLASAGGGVLSFQKLDRIRSAIEGLGFTGWFHSKLSVLLYMTAFAVLAFLLLVLIAMRVIDGLWMFSIARNFLIVAVLCSISLIFELLPRSAFIGFFATGLMLVVIVSFMAFGPAREHLEERAIGDFVGELLFLSPFLVLFWPVYWAMPSVEIAWEATHKLWQQLSAYIA